MKKKNITPAYYGGNKIIDYDLKKYNSIGKEELEISKKVIKSGKLSSFIAGKKKNFYGGIYVNRFEKYLKKFYNVKYAITLNSWTSGLIASIGALDIEPGDEIITTPWTMSACATAILHWNAIPVFADIDVRTFCINPNSIKQKISKKTKAVLAVDIFGISADIQKIKKVIGRRDIKIISDSAQAPYFFYRNKLASTSSDIGGFSLNCHKHINTGEGGIVVTNNKNFANRVYKIRNHGETSVSLNSKINNILGYNFRMGEIECAIGLEQYKKLKKIILSRNIQFNYLAKNLSKLKGLTIPTYRVKMNNYYLFPIVLDPKIINASRKKIIKLLQAEGVKGLIEGYANLHKLPLFQRKIAYGNKGFPWNTFNKKIKYQNGSCPNAERLHEKTFIGYQVCLFNYSKKDINNVIKAFKKIWNYLDL
jgi:perosamine synthetase